MSISKETILGERLRRQRLVAPLETAEEYIDLFTKSAVKVKTQFE